MNSANNHENIFYKIRTQCLVVKVTHSANNGRLLIYLQISFKNLYVHVNRYHYFATTIKARLVQRSKRLVIILTDQRRVFGVRTLGL